MPIMNKGEEVTLTKIPLCDFCKREGLETDAEYDFATILDGWAYGCRKHWLQYRRSAALGMGSGQRLVLTQPKVEVSK